MYVHMYVHTVGWIVFLNKYFHIFYGSLVNIWNISPDNLNHLKHMTKNMYASFMYLHTYVHMYALYVQTSNF